MQELPLTDFVKDKHNSDGYTGQCKSCRNTKKKEYREGKNRDAIRIRLNMQDKKYREKKKLEHEQWLDNHKEEVALIKTLKKILSKKRKAEWNIKNRDKYEYDSVEEHKKYLIYKQNNHEQLKQQWRRARHMRRARNKQSLIELTTEQWNETLEFFNNSCAYCGDAEKITQDHIIPLSKGGDYVQHNIIPACQRCNYSKHTAEMNDWYKHQSFFSLPRVRRIRQWMYEAGQQDLFGNL